MNLPGIGRIMLDSMKKEGLTVKLLDAKKYVEEKTKTLNLTTEELKENTKNWNGFYRGHTDFIYINTDSSIKKEYLLLHEAIHAVRANPKRTMRLFQQAFLHSTMKSIIEKTAKKLDNSSAITKIFCEKARQDIRYWREESIADCIALFMCVEYGSKTKRSSIETLRATFIPFAFKDAFNQSDRNRFATKIKSECLITLDFIIDNYTNGLFNKKLIRKRFKDFFDKEILYCYKYVAKKEKSKLTINRNQSGLSSVIAGKQVYK